MNGRIHSVETMGTVDGPGMRMVVFLQGCPMRCAYCHNPDTWDVKGDFQLMSVEDLWQQFERNRQFYSNGGITVSGGEALMQIEFVTELFTYFRERNVHTCLDTSGICFDPHQEVAYRQLLAVTSLVILDIKDIDPEKHQWLTAQPIEPILNFARLTAEVNTPIWVRHVVVPGITDVKERHYRLGFFLGSLNNIQAVDCLPYHVMGVSKYKELGLDYRLEGVPAATKALATDASKTVVEGIKAYRRHWWIPIKTEHSMS
ncbi:pyruvate formate-lyase-activating protein [Veillonella sp. YH-vei2232]|jgi:pyruvate formate lyase activating enzyme|uniref:Pyruvate formate-lyase-activating enzyme n=1 Tax=Veillonella absiana TaxID=3079305 RepID=A0ABU3Z6Z2_9FIRM|nr:MULTISPECIES: pyruvate formate-lyase-activating protein [unclassified Veillonella]MBP8617553.1 pyruvate formate lyase-activating protein [Veillonella sp.]MDV5063880.1 pyruvate formate-lyase-activating protein [Veillonella sp. YH-vei2232]MDV5087482.1 pyruvate formate-lyase-activating protein [Veillonella sp. YH-vei2233]